MGAVFWCTWDRYVFQRGDEKQALATEGQKQLVNRASVREYLKNELGWQR